VDKELSDKAYFRLRPNTKNMWEFILESEPTEYDEDFCEEGIVHWGIDLGILVDWEWNRGKKK
jgi:hypothetical protein|tara:strand:+ start:284 stop:472 length:189 start_codon:yes stop_codon:yes gene_type:complete